MHAGRTLPCPNCGAMVNVPSLQPQPASPTKSPKQASGNSSFLLLIAAGGGFVGFLLLCLVAWWMFSRDEPSADGTSVAAVTDVPATDNVNPLEPEANLSADSANPGGLESFDVSGLMALGGPAIKLQ